MENQFILRDGLIYYEKIGLIFYSFFVLLVAISNFIFDWEAIFDKKYKYQPVWKNCKR